MSTLAQRFGHAARRGATALTITAFAGFVGYLAWVNPAALLVREVRFEGNARASVAELRHLADLPNGASLVTLRPNHVARAIERHPWVRAAGVRRTATGVAVTVEEFVPVALAATPGGLYYADADGRLILPARADDLDYPVVTGLDHDVVGRHPSLPQVILRDAAGLVDALDERGLVAPESISELAFAPTRGFTVHLRRGAVLRFGLDAHAEQVDRLARIVDDGVSLDAPLTIDLVPSRVAIVHPRVDRGQDG